jgi:hypothetical protein
VIASLRLRPRHLRREVQRDPGVDAALTWLQGKIADLAGVVQRPLQHLDRADPPDPSGEMWRTWIILLLWMNTVGCVPTPNCTGTTAPRSPARITGRTRLGSWTPAPPLRPSGSARPARSRCPRYPVPLPASGRIKGRHAAPGRYRHQVVERTHSAAPCPGKAGRAYCPSRWRSG